MQERSHFLVFGVLGDAGGVEGWEFGFVVFGGEGRRGFGEGVDVDALVGAAGCEEHFGGFLGGRREGEASDRGCVGVEEEGVGEVDFGLVF